MNISCVSYTADVSYATSNNNRNYAETRCYTEDAIYTALGTVFRLSISDGTIAETSVNELSQIE